MKQVIIFLLLTITLNGYAQQLLLNGKITYEKKFSIVKSIEQEMEEDGDDDDSWYKEMIKTMPKYKVDIFKLSFTRNQAIYTTFLEDENERLRWYKTITNLTQKTDFVTDSFMQNRTVYDESFLIKDSISKPVWKLTGEYRNIAGYNCRRATTILYDSVFVIAFFTEAIPVSGGPDIFAGLPGMILGVVLPRFHTTIFATSVETVVPNESDFLFKPIRKAKVLSREGYRKDLSSNLERWGKYGQRFVLKALF
ncbi:MAG: GLPGLI family protein [Bacteroidetes bacterium]|nr:MAG: GLPGLI family protein [Bacteroidota bacterium]